MRASRWPLTASAVDTFSTRPNRTVRARNQKVCDHSWRQTRHVIGESGHPICMRRPRHDNSSLNARTVVLVVQNVAVDHHSAVEVIELLAHRVGLGGIHRALVRAVVDEHVLPVAFAEVVVEGWRGGLHELQQYCAFTTCRCRGEGEDQFWGEDNGLRQNVHARKWCVSPIRLVPLVHTCSE